MIRKTRATRRHWGNIFSDGTRATWRHTLHSGYIFIRRPCLNWPSPSPFFSLMPIHIWYLLLPLRSILTAFECTAVIRPVSVTGKAKRWFWSMMWPWPSWHLKILWLSVITLPPGYSRRAGSEFRYGERIIIPSPSPQRGAFGRIPQHRLILLFYGLFPIFGRRGNVIFHCVAWSLVSAVRVWGVLPKPFSCLERISLLVRGSLTDFLLSGQSWNVLHSCPSSHQQRLSESEAQSSPTP